MLNAKDFLIGFSCDFRQDEQSGQFVICMRRLTDQRVYPAKRKWILMGEKIEMFM